MSGGAPRGARNGSAVLTEAAVRDIRARYRPYHNASALGREHGVSRQTILAVVNGYLWGHVE